MIGLIDNRRFNALTERWSVVTEGHIDKGLRDAMQVLNALEGVRTVWCCEGPDPV